MDIIHGIKTCADRIAGRAVELFTGSGSSGVVSASEKSAAYRSEELSRLNRAAAADSVVLLENDGVLPLKKTDTLAVFGRCQYDWFYVGYGSGGGVRAPYRVNLIDGLRNAGANIYEPLAKEYERLCTSKEFAARRGFWGHWPFSHPEVPISGDMWSDTAAACPDACALIVIGRAAGEDRDLQPKKGSYYLTDDEKELIDIAVESFDRVIVILNIGSLIDLSWISEYGRSISAVLVAWLGGQDSGSAVADVLFGDTAPSGRLPDTAARKLSDYPSTASFAGGKRTEYSEGIYVGYRHFDRNAPDAVLYPFGYGLSYTTFRFEPHGFVRTRTGVFISVKVKNTGAVPGKTSALIFAIPPKNGLDKPVKTLVGFKKTRVLAPGEEQALTVVADNTALSSFSEEEHAFVMDKGEYSFEAEGVHLGGFTLAERMTVETVHGLKPSREELKSRIEAAIPEEPLAPENVDLGLAAVLDKTITLDEFVADLSKPELEALTRGHGMMDSPLGPKGNAGVFGGVIKPLADRGVPVISCCDGPAGLRMGACCTLVPCGTALAATFDTELVEALHTELAREMAHNNVDVRLAPGMNLHRNPLCGRNFEYFSEDPVLSGRMGAACVRGVRAGGKAACPKHFACNNREAFRMTGDSVVSERALRELYLRNFEIMVKESRPDLIMTSYNMINGVYSYYNFDLVTTVLRDEWGFDGAVMTDWWMKTRRSPEYKKLRGNAYRVRSQVDILMPGSRLHVTRRYSSDGTLLRTLRKKGGIKKAEIMRSAKNALSVIIKLKKDGITGPGADREA
ncbi:MAG: glycoside hydrolase family 3 protein [Clostridia bacterium]|nr:glycoside hydrolase family 3 protein [Clostridia bacterium]